MEHFPLVRMIVGDKSRFHSSTLGRPILNERNRLITAFQFDFGPDERHSDAMMRLLLLLLVLAAGLSQIAAAQDRTLIAEGDYVAQSENGNKPVAHWKLSRLTSGEHEVTESFVRNPFVTQIFRFDAQFLPIGYSLAVNPQSGQSARPRPDLRPTSFSYIYKANELACDAEYEGRKSHASIAAKEPYTVAIDEYWFADITWAFTGVVRRMQHAGANETLVNAYLIKDNDTGGIVLSPDTPTKLVLVGAEQANVLGKMQTVRRYESADHSVLLVTKDGLVAAVIPKGPADSVRLIMGNYQQYKPLELDAQ
jgi:hypothetical protein